LLLHVSNQLPSILEVIAVEDRCSN